MLYAFKNSMSTSQTSYSVILLGLDDKKVAVLWLIRASILYLAAAAKQRSQLI